MPKYRIYGASRETGVEQTITITADTDRDAEAVASGRGVMVSRIVELEEAVASAAAVRSDQHRKQHDAGSGEERVLWQGSPSQWTNFWAFFWCVVFSWLIIPILIAVWKYLLTNHTRYELTTERLKSRTGVLSQKMDEIELYRIKDSTVDNPFILRILGLGNIRLITSDKSTPVITIPAIKDAREVRETIRKRVEYLRDKKRVREVDYE